MSDYELFLRMITGKTEFKIVSNKWSNFPNSAKEIEVYNTKDENGFSLMGYSGFSSNWLFDKDGNFLAVGHYE